MAVLQSPIASFMGRNAGDWWANNGGRKWRAGRGPQHSINFITAHDGFTLSDLVAYNKKHNEANGEGNRCASKGCHLRIPVSMTTPWI